jgi:gamma-glutamyltranspeptidase/glutathione hydrolase
MGHHMIPVSGLGRLMGIKYDAENDIYSGASDSSSPDGAAIGY